MLKGTLDLDAAALRALHVEHRGAPAVKSRRARWASLLTTAVGTGFVESDALFVDHTLLVTAAEIIAHAVAGLDLAAPEVSAASLTGGQLFAAARIHGVAGAECFDWVAAVPGGDRLVAALARRLSRFTFRDVERDVLKGLYESVVSTEQRRKLGEYYTPDWLADRIVDAVVTDPLRQRVLDPACGSGTFLFHAIRRYLGAAREAGIDDAEALTGLTRHVSGVDIHPVAVAFARVTYLLAIGPERLQARDRPPLSIPVHLGDGIPWGEAPAPLARDAHDVLVGNPPWLSYRFMPPAMQGELRRLSEERGLWAGGAVATNQDLSTLFVLRSIERHLRAGGRFGFVMPWSVLRGRQHAGFRRGRYALAQGEDLAVAFGASWDLHAVRPAFFPVPACVVFGEHAEEPASISSAVETWSGRLPRPDVGWSEARRHLSRSWGEVVEAVEAAPGVRSPYDPRFLQGATILPRVLVVVEERPSGDQGAGAGRASIVSRRSANDKAPWRSIPSLEGTVERRFVRAMVASEALLPYRTQGAALAVIPWDGQRLLHGQDARLALHAGLEAWWREAERIWETHHPDLKLSLIGRLDYHHGLSQQLPAPAFRVVYGASGMYVAAAIIEGDAVVEHGLYWGAVGTREEGRYLEAVLNSDVLTRLVRPLQARGEHNPRHIDKLVWQLPIPLHDPDDERHRRLATLAEEAEEIAAGVTLPAGKRNATLRGLVREAVAASDAGRQIEEEVAGLLAPRPERSAPGAKARR